LVASSCSQARRVDDSQERVTPGVEGVHVSGRDEQFQPVADPQARRAFRRKRGAVADDLAGRRLRSLLSPRGIQLTRVSLISDDYSEIKSALELG
jgi:hypothetical protein